MVNRVLWYLSEDKSFQDIPVNVLMKVNILYLANFDSELMEYSIDLELEMSWFDIR